MLPYEGETGRPSDALRTKKSTRVRLMVSAYGGPNGGTVSFTRTNFGKLRLVGTSGFELPSPLHLDAGQAFFASCVCEGVEASAEVNDITVSGRLVEEGTGTPHAASANLTSCAVSFVTPTGDPAVRAEETDAGDGQNEFTFDDATQTLTIGLKVRIEPDVTQLAGLGQCAFALPLIRGADLFWEDNDGNLGHPMPLSAGAGALVHATACYVGYPLSNSEFGRKTVTFRVLGLTVSSDFEVFFPSDGTHHPACSTCRGCPNWFYYWREGGVCEIPSYVAYCKDRTVIWAGRYFPFTDRCILLSWLAPGHKTKIKGKKCHRWIKKQLRDPKDPSSVYYTPEIKELGVLEFGCDSAGVKAVAAILKHEHRHKDIEESFPDLIDRNPDDDYDEDSVLDKDEISGRWGLVTLTNCFDTFKISYEDGMEMYRKNADNEVLARKAEESPLVYFVDRDWCNPGCQSKVRRGPDIDETDSVK